MERFRMGWRNVTLPMLLVTTSALAAQPERYSSYWCQFGDGHRTEIPVAQWLSSVEELWHGTIAGYQVTLQWNGAEITATLEDETALLVVAGWDDSERPTFELFDEVGENLLATGFVDVDEASGWAIVEIVASGEEARRFAGPALLPGDSDELIMCTTCKCFGIGTIKNECTNKQCDEGESCGDDGKNNNACRWTAGSGTSCKNVAPTSPLSNVLGDGEGGLSRGG